MLTYPESLGHLLDHALESTPDAVAVIQGEIACTYRELDEAANRVGNAILDAGGGVGDRVLMLMENDLRFAECLIGVVRAGCIAVPVNPKYGAEQHAQLASDCGARIVLTTRGCEGSSVHLVDRALVDVAVVIDGTAGVGTDYRAWTATAATTRPAYRAAPTDVCIQAYTSGSSGVPKGVLLTHKGLLQNVHTVADAFRLTPSDRALLSTPLFHMNASGAGLLPCLAVGASVVVLPGFDPRHVIEAVDRHACTYTTGVPAMYKMLLASMHHETSNGLGSLRFIACGSAPMPKSLLEELAEVLPEVDIIEGYGLTECGPVAVTNPRGANVIGSIGVPLPGFETRIVDENGAECAPGDVGELLLRSECRALGYHARPDAETVRFDVDGWVHTGDLMRRDHAGFLYFVGRADDMLSVGGENVYPAEVEGVLAAHPAVSDVTVVSRPHEVKGEVPVAFVVVEPGAHVQDDELITFFLERGPAHAHPREVHILEVMPLAPTGKPDRKALTDLASSPAVS